MKYITLAIGLLVVGCGKQEQTDTNKSTPTTNTNVVDGTTEKPVKELTLREKAIGTYEAKEGEDTIRVVLLETGIGEGYENGKKKTDDAKWELVEGEIHLTQSRQDIVVFSINKDGSLAFIAEIIRNKREDLPKDGQWIFKKIK